MIPRTGGTDEGRERERVSTERKTRGAGRWFLPLLLALPFLAVIVFAAVRFGPRLLEMINVAIKGAVVS